MNIQTEADELGFFGDYGGQYVPETLMPAIIELKKLINKLNKTKHFKMNSQVILKTMLEEKRH